MQAYLTEVAAATLRMTRGRGDRGRARCTVCGAAADVHCAADAAFLCCACDGEVHGANLVASRHRRTRVSTMPTRSPGDAVMEGWARRMGVAAGTARRSATAAGRALRFEITPVAPGMPLHVGMAVALWREVAPHFAGLHQAVHALRGLEACAHVPARLIVAVAISIGRAAVLDAEEGFGECSGA